MFVCVCVYENKQISVVEDNQRLSLFTYKYLDDLMISKNL